MDQIILFGDSLTQMSSAQDKGFAFHAALQEAYIRRLDVANRGLSGYNTSQALSVLPRIVTPPTHTSRIKLFVIFFGANDARLPNTPGPAQTVSLQEFEENMMKIATYPALLQHDPKILLVTPPPIDERGVEEDDRTKGITVPRRTAENTARYAEAVRGLGKRLNCPVVDLWKAFMKEAGWTDGGEGPLPGSKEIPRNDVLKDTLYDGLHFNPRGYEILYKEFMKVVEKDLPELRPEGLPFVLPTWDDASWPR